MATSTLVSAQPAAKGEGALQPVHAGKPGSSAFWNSYAGRFIYPPAFEISETKGAAFYRFTVTGSDGRQHRFKEWKPWNALTPVWEAVPEGVTELEVTAMDRAGKAVAAPVKRTFYRSPAFPGVAIKPASVYFNAGRQGLEALFKTPAVQYWLQHKKPDPAYARYCFPNKVIGGLLRGMIAYVQLAATKRERTDALQMARNMGDYLLSVRQPATAHYAFIPPTYLNNVETPAGPALKRWQEGWFMVPSAIDAALGFLDLFDATGDSVYFQATQRIAQTLAATQEPDGTWPLMVKGTESRPVTPQRLIPTPVILFFDRMEQQYAIHSYRLAKERAWSWILKNPLETYQWDGQFEDVALHGAYKNLAREQACDVASLLLDQATGNPAGMAQAEELLRFAEDQFVVWAPVKDPEGWNHTIGGRKRAPETWFAPTVLEQYVCYEPVARSSAVLIHVYLKAHTVTKKQVYLEKAAALANGLLAGQSWISETYGGIAEIPTWVKKVKPSNWMNNSFYAAEAVLRLATVLNKIQERTRAGGSS